MGSPNSKKRRRGQAMIEFVLVSALFWVPLIGLLMNTGFRLVRSVELLQLVDDVSQMWARGVDFSSPTFQTLLTGTLASPFSLPANPGNNLTGGGTGNMVIVLSQYFYVNPADPKCVSLAALCVNGGNTVVERRIIIGNQKLIGANGALPSVGTLASPDLNTTTGTCEPGTNLPLPNNGNQALTTCQYTVSSIQASSFNTIMSTSLLNSVGGTTGGTVFLAEGYYVDFLGRLIYQRSID